MAQKTKKLMIEDLNEGEITYLEYVMRPYEGDGRDDPRRQEEILSGGVASDFGSFEGFLSETDSLVDVIQEDRQTLKNQRITYVQIADSLEYFDRWFIKNNGKVSSYENMSIFFNDLKFKVDARPTLGPQFCPYMAVRFDFELYPNFEACGGGSVDYILKKGNKDFKFSSLLPHLIKDHHFFEGDVPHRVDPKEVIDFLELKPKVNYKYKKK